MLTVRLELGDRSYDIIIEAVLISKLGGRLKAMGFSGRAAVITNPVVERLYAGAVKNPRGSWVNPVVFIVPDGEEHKSLSEAGSLYDRMIDARMERGSPVIALGGGVIGLSALWPRLIKGRALHTGSNDFLLRWIRPWAERPR